jgi:hypothetical protein
MRARPVTVSRRALLGSIAAFAVGCRSSRRKAPDPDAAALAEARDTETRLIAAYTALATTAQGADATSYARFTAAHQAHLEALTTQVAASRSPSPSAPSTLSRADTGALVSSSATRLQAAALAASSGHHAAVLASIAGAHLAEVDLAHPPVGRR